MGVVDVIAVFPGHGFALVEEARDKRSWTGCWRGPRRGSMWKVRVVGRLSDRPGWLS